MEKKSKFVSVYEYAKLCEVSLTAIQFRIARGTLKVVEKLVPKNYIDLEVYPPAKLKRGAPKKLKTKQ